MATAPPSAVMPRAATLPLLQVVDTVKTSDLKGKQPYCRCFMSGTFPQCVLGDCTVTSSLGLRPNVKIVIRLWCCRCDGSHAKHNQRTGDNVGPLIISKDE